MNARPFAFIRGVTLTVAAVLLAGLCAPAQAALVGYWSYENAGNLGQDTSGTGNNLVNSGTPASGAGKFGTGLELNGTNAMLVPSGGFPTGVPTGNSAYTTASWFNADTGGNRGIVGYGNYGTNNQVNALRMNGTDQLINYWWGNDMTAAGLGDLTVGASPDGWRHATATYNPTTQEHRLYLDGKQVAARVATGFNAQPVNFAVGRTCCSEFFDGQLDDTAIYNTALAPNQIVALGKGAAQPNALPTASPLVGLWRFNDAANIGLDSSGVQNNLVAAGNATQAGGGVFGGALSLDGNGDFLGANAAGTAMATGIPFGNSSYTIAAYFKADAATNAVGNQNGIVGWGNYGANNQVTALRMANDVFANGNGFRHYWWANDQDLPAGAINLLDGQYHHVVAVYDDLTNTRSIYLDGLLLGTQNIGDHAGAPVNFTIGKTFGTEFFDGLLDDVAIFNVALTPAQIDSIRRGDFSEFLAAVPEPTSAMLGLLGAAVLGLRRRRTA